MRTTTKYDLVRFARGSVELFSRSGGKDTPLMSMDNLILYSGADIAAKAIGGIAGGVVNAMYFEYSNVAIAVGPALARDRDETYYPGLLAANSVGYSRVPTIATPALTPSSADYVGNQVEFVAVTDGTYEAGGIALTDGTSRIYGMALVAVVDWADQTTDRLFSAVNIEVSGALSPITKIANAQIGARWKIRFL